MPITDENLLLMCAVFVFGFSFLHHVDSTTRERFYTDSSSLTSPSKSIVKLMLTNRDAGAFITHLGLDPHSFDVLLEFFEKKYPPANPGLGRPRAFGPDMALALVLMYLHNTMKQETLCLLFGATAAVISRTKRLGLDTLESIFRNDPHHWRWDIAWPSPRKMQRFNDMILANTECDNEPEVLDGVFGFVDGLNLPIQEPSDEAEQNAYYNGWKSACYASQVIVFTPDGCICYVRSNCPGSWHDAEIAVKLYQDLLLPRCPPPFRLFADSGFPCSGEYAEKILRVPKKSEVKNMVVDDEVLNKWKAITKNRQAAEWGMGAVQHAFGRLRLKEDSSYLSSGECIISALGWLALTRSTLFILKSGRNKSYKPTILICLLE
ncbi:unnamed protein product [Absidia cylindrospora]